MQISKKCLRHSGDWPSKRYRRRQKESIWLDPNQRDWLKVKYIPVVLSFHFITFHSIIKLPLVAAGRMIFTRFVRGKHRKWNFLKPKLMNERTNAFERTKSWLTSMMTHWMDQSFYFMIFIYDSLNGTISSFHFYSFMTANCSGNDTIGVGA